MRLLILEVLVFGIQQGSTAQFRYTFTHMHTHSPGYSLFVVVFTAIDVTDHASHHSTYTVLALNSGIPLLIFQVCKYICQGSSHNIMQYLEPVGHPIVLTSRTTSAPHPRFLYVPYFSLSADKKRACSLRYRPIFVWSAGGFNNRYVTFPLRIRKMAACNQTHSTVSVCMHSGGM